MLDNASFFVFKPVVSRVSELSGQIEDMTLSIKIKETRQKHSFLKTKKRPILGLFFYFYI